MEEIEGDNSDCGSYELIDYNGSDSDPEIQIVEADNFINMNHSDDGYGSYEFVPSEEESFKSTTDSEDNDKAEDEESFKSTTDSEDNNMAEDSESDSYEEPPSDSEFPDSLSVGDSLAEVQRFLTLAFPDELPASIKCKNNVTIEDIVKNHVLPYLPAKSLTRFRLVSREWDQWISSPFLAHMQSHVFKTISGFFAEEGGYIYFISLDRSVYGVPSCSLEFLPQLVSIKSSSNGLLLCEGRITNDSYYICNPVNQEWVELPCSGYHHYKQQRKTVLAFQPSSLDFEPSFRVISAFTPFGYESGIYFDVYDSTTQLWTVSDVTLFDLNVSDLQGDGFFMDDMVYWETAYDTLIVVDLKNLIYSLQALPSGRDSRGMFSKMHGELCYLEAWYRRLTNTCEINVYGGCQMSLLRTISFDVNLDDLGDCLPSECRVLASHCEDVVVVLLKDYLFVYDVRSQKVEGPTAVGASDYWYLVKSKFFPYVNSLVSVEAAK